MLQCVAVIGLNAHTPQLTRYMYLYTYPTCWVYCAVLQNVAIRCGVLQWLGWVSILLKVGLGISRTNADSPWNPVYNVFHRNFGCKNETIHRQFCTRDFDAVNLQPALEQGCGEQKPSVRKLFSRANLLDVPNIKTEWRPRSRSVHNFGTCIGRTAAQWQNPILPASKQVFFLRSRHCAAVLQM